MLRLPTTSNHGFSVLLALGSIGVLMIIVIGMVQVFLSEMKLSRYQYDYILASEQVEGAFEYAMLKVGNHRDGFQDEFGESDLDQVIFSGNSVRSQNNKVSYKISAQTSNYTKVLQPTEYLIFPLFTGDDEYIASGKPSKNPRIQNLSSVAKNFRMNLSTSPEDIYWSIIAMSGGINTSLSGTGEINGTEIGTSRNVGRECFDNTGAPRALVNDFCPPGLIASGGEELQYFYDTTSNVEDFLKAYGNGPTSTQVKDPFFLVYNKGVSPISLNLQSDASGPFTLPDLSITVEAKKGRAVQTIRFHSDKSKYYDGLKYSLYDTN